MKTYEMHVTYDGFSITLDKIIDNVVGKASSACVGTYMRDLLFTFKDKAKRDEAVKKVRQIKNTKTLKVVISES